MLDKETKTMLQMLKLNFPNLTFYKEGGVFGDPLGSDYAPPYELGWDKFLLLLRENGFDITYSKSK